MIVERFGLFARFGFMHLVATNLSLWVRTIIWESANEWIHHIHRYNSLLAKGAGGVGDGVSIAIGGGDGSAPLALELKEGQGYRR